MKSMKQKKYTFRSLRRIKFIKEYPKETILFKDLFFLLHVFLVIHGGYVPERF
jgi:hypothetical protein